MAQTEFSTKNSYQEFLGGLKDVLPIRNPAGLISAVIGRNFRWALDKGVPFEELFHEGVVALWSAYQDNELPLEGQAVSFYWTRLRWFLLGYCRALFKEQAVPMSQLVSSDDEEYEYWLQQNILRDPQSLQYWGSLNDLIDEIMKVVREKGLQGKSSSPRRKNIWKSRGGMEQKLRLMLQYLAAGYNGTEIAAMLGYKTEHGVNRTVQALSRKLLEDEQFREAYGELLPPRDYRRQGGQFRGSTQATEEELEETKERFRELIPEDVLEAASRKAFGGKLTKREEIRLDQFREQWGWLLG